MNPLKAYYFFVNNQALNNNNNKNFSILQKKVLIQFPMSSVLPWVSTVVCNLSVLVRRLLWPYYPSVSLRVVWPVRQNSACRQQPCSWEGERSSWEASPDINITSIYQVGKHTTVERPKLEKKDGKNWFRISGADCRKEVRSHLKVVNRGVKKAAPSSDFHLWYILQ